MKNIEQIEQFAGIITAKIDSSSGQTVSLLKKIEKNTSILPRLGFGTLPASPGQRQTARVAPGSSFPRTRRLSKIEHPAPVTSTPTATARRAIRDETTRQRDSHGRFIGKSKSQEAVAERKDGTKKKSLLQSLQDGFKVASTGGTIKEAAGRAAGGPIFEAAVELKDTFDSFRDGDGFWQKISKKLRSGTRTGNSNKTVVKALRDSETKEEKRHKELVKAILESNRGGSDSGVDLDLPLPSKLMKGKLLGGLGTLLSRFALPGIALAGAGLAGAGIGTLLNNLINKLGEKVTGKKGWSLGDQIYDWTHKDAASTFETGAKKTSAQAAGTISTGKGDKGGKSYGSYQLSSKMGEVESFIQKYGYASQFKGLQVGTKEFDAKWKQLADQDPRFAIAQKQYAIKTKYNPQMQKLYSEGIDLSGKGKAVQEMVLSTANQYGASTSVIKKALQGKDIASMSGADIISAVQDYKAANVDSDFRSSSSKVRLGVAKRIRKERAYLLAMDSREQKPTAVAKNEASAKKPKTTAVTKSETSAEQKPIPETQTAPPQSASSLVATSEDPLSTPSIPTVTAKPATDIRKHVLSQIQEQARTIGRSVGLDDTLVDGALSMAGDMIPEPIRSFATSAKPFGNLPERMTTAIDKMPLPDIVKSGAKQVTGNLDQNPVLMAALSKLTTAIGKMPGNDEAARPGVPVIKTEFDDTMLTLMAYDRI